MRRRGRRGGLSPFAAGLIAVAVVAGAAFFAFTRFNPFADPYEVSAVFESVQNLKPRSPVRIAGVEVGEVTEVEALDDGSGHARVKMELSDEALPLHTDAHAQIVPRLFLEGNFVVAISPGTPAEPRIDDGGTIPVGQTSHSVSFEQVLKVLDKDTRQSLQTLLDEYSSALAEGGARGFNRSIRYWEEAYRNTALANQGLLGTRPGDLARVVRGQQRAFEALGRNPEALQALVTGLNVTTRAFASEDDALRATIPALRDVLRAADPALASVDAALPSLRAFARDALPGVRSTPETLAVSEPFVEQLARLVRPGELRGVARDLRAAIPALARLNAASIGLLRETRLLSSCTNEVLVPFAATPIPDPDFPEASGQPFYKEVQRSFVGLAGESRVGDANGQWFRVNAGSGATTLVIPGGENVETLYAQTNFPQLGARPDKPARRPRFRPDVPCETQEPPDLNAPLGNPDQEIEPSPDPTPFARRLQRRLDRALPDLVDAFRRARAGKPYENPLRWELPRQEGRR